MYLQELLEVAIGLIFVWLVLSIATMQVQEWIATNWLKWRSRDLEKAIGNMLADPEKVKAFYEHPLIQSLSEKTRKKPSYIPAANFSAALFDIVVKAGTEESPIQKKLGELQMLVEGLKEKDPEVIKKTAGNFKVIYQKLAQLTANSGMADALKKQIKDTVKSQLDEIEKKGVSRETIDALKSQVDQYQSELGDLLKNKDLLDKLSTGAIALAIDSYSKGQLGKSLSSLLAGVEDYATDTEKALAIGRKNIEGWFDSTMERLSGWYKRKAQVMALFIGLILAIVMNVDSIALAKHLWKEPAVRQALAATADKFIEENPNIEKQEGGVPPEQAIAEFQKRFDGLTLPIGWDFYMWKAEEDASCKELVVVSRVPGGPVFRVPPPVNGAFLKQCMVITNLPDKGEWILKILGISITALAAMQ